MAGRSISAPAGRRTVIASRPVTVTGGLVLFAVLITGVLAFRETDGAVPLAPVIVAAMVGAPLMIRLAGIRLVMSEGGVLVRNVFRTRRVPWNDLTRIGAAVPWWSARGGMPGLAFECGPGRRIVSSATVTISPDRARWIARVAILYAAAHGIDCTVVSEPEPGP